MRLKSCYIENYGAICGKTFVFNAGLTEQLLENGAGKTTLASFLQAMLYGLESYRSNAVGFCDRQRYYPFTGGVFGGSLTFEHGGKEYKIERTFGEKSDTADTLKVYCDGEVTTALGAEIGKALLGVDKEGFRRTAFIGNEDIEIAANSSISAKLNGFLQGVDEDAGFERALNALEQAAKVYQKKGKGSDRIGETNEKIGELKQRISNAEGRVRALEQRYLDEEELKKQIQALSARISEAQIRNERLGEWEYYERLLAARQEAEKNLAQLQARYPLGLPSEEDLQELRKLRDELTGLSAQTEKKSFSLADEGRLEEYTRRFFSGVPTETEIAGIERTVDELSKLEAEIKFYEEKEKTGEEGRLLQKFGVSYPTEEELLQGEWAARRCDELKNELVSLPEVVLEEKTGRTGLKKYAILGAIFAALAVLGGVLTLVEPFLGLALLGVGVVAGLVDGFLYLNRKSSGEKGGAQGYSPKRQEKERELRAAEDTVRALVLPYGYALEGGERMAVYRLQEDLKRYLALQEKERARTRALLEKQEEIRRRKELLQTAFAQYKIAAEKPLKALSELRSAVEEYAALSARKASAVASDTALAGEYAKGNERLYGYLRRYGLQELNLPKLEEDLHTFRTAKEGLEKATQAAESYRKEKALTDKPNGEREDIASLNACLQELRRKEAMLVQEISEDEYEVEKLDEHRAELERQQVRLKEYKEKHRLLTGAAALLQEADKRLKDKYVKPIKDEFIAIAAPLERAIGEKLVMTKNFEIRYDLHGKERSEKHLSAGQRSICALCFRLALIKNMYADGLPFLILDDPFVHLDETHMSRVRGLLKELSKDFQILYFTCHESRSVKE